MSSTGRCQISNIGVKATTAERKVGNSLSSVRAPKGTTEDPKAKSRAK
jgi:hypothetical protein